MTVQQIGIRAMALYITEQELRARNLTPAAIGRREAEALLCTALEEANLDGWEVVELEVYTGKDAVLLFARRKSGAPQHFFFADFETLISAAHLCPETLPSALSLAPRGGYVLTVYPFEGDAHPAVLEEYGDPLGGSVYLVAHLLEQGAVLISAGALACLQGYFSI